MSPKNAKGISEIVQCSRFSQNWGVSSGMGLLVLKPEQSWLDQDIGHRGCEM